MSVTSSVRSMADRAGREPSADDSAGVDLEAMLAGALEAYRVRVLDNVDLSRAPSLEARLRIVGRALMATGDAKAFVLGRRLLAAAD